jgi:hypothetical protein
MAQPEIQHLAILMQKAMDDSTPKELNILEWHLPYITEAELKRYDNDILLKMSVARCARVSYLTQEGNIPNLSKDLELYERLVGSEPIHASPCEHQATPKGSNYGTRHTSNLVGWVQFRKLIEEDFKK